jgi:hypothetical protein
MIILSLIIMRNRFSIRTLMFSSRNFLTSVLGTFCLLMIPHINLYLMIHVVLYFLELFEGADGDGDYMFSTILTWFRFTRLGLMFILT